MSKKEEPKKKDEPVDQSIDDGDRFVKSKETKSKEQLIKEFEEALKGRIKNK